MYKGIIMPCGTDLAMSVSGYLISAQLCFFLCILLSQCLFVYFYQNNYKKTERRMVSIKNIETNAKKLFKTFPAEVTNVSKADYSKKLF